MEWIEVPGVVDGGSGVVVEGYGAGKMGIAVYLRDGRAYAVSNKCAHGKGQLACGDIEELSSCHFGAREDGSTRPGLVVACPKHREKFPGGLRFSLIDGSSFVVQPTDHYSPQMRLETFPVKVEGGRVFVSPVARQPITKAHRWGVFLEKVKRNLGLKDNSSLKPSSSSEWAEWLCMSFRKVTAESFIVELRAPAGWLPGPSASSNVDKLMWHVTLRASVGGELVARDYTPISSAEDYRLGRLELWIKVYKDGKLTPHLERALANQGSVVSVGPAEVTADLPEGVTKVSLIGGGTGLTPLLQAAHHPSVSEAHLLWAVRHRADAPDELHRAVTSLPNHRVTFTRDDKDGRVNLGLIKKSGPKPSRSVAVFVSGPEGFNATVMELLSDLGFEKPLCFELEA
jgi:ferredoxin-NADP reductase/nitrite reductase/ring-hydroxylating ferredoxin subunit